MEFEEIKDKLTQPQYDFFYELKEYVELPIYFIGSILRYDYFKGYSDLDVIIFSPDIDSIKLKIKHFLNIDKKDRIIFLHINKVPISGYKFYYNVYLKFLLLVANDLLPIKFFVRINLGIILVKLPAIYCVLLINLDLFHLRSIQFYC